MGAEREHEEDERADSGRQQEKDLPERAEEQEGQEDGERGGDCQDGKRLQPVDQREREQSAAGNVSCAVHQVEVGGGESPIVGIHQGERMGQDEADTRQ